MKRLLKKLFRIKTFVRVLEPYKKEFLGEKFDSYRSTEYTYCVEYNTFKVEWFCGGGCGSSWLGDKECDILRKKINSGELYLNVDLQGSRTNKIKAYKEKKCLKKKN
jgi:hypothetical protein